MCGPVTRSSDPSGTRVKLKFTLFGQDKVIGGHVFLHQEVPDVM